MEEDDEDDDVDDVGRRGGGKGIGGVRVLDSRTLCQGEGCGGRVLLRGQMQQVNLLHLPALVPQLILEDHSRRVISQQEPLELHIRRKKTKQL